MFNNVEIITVFEILIEKLKLKAQLWYTMKIVRYNFKFYNIENTLNREEIFGKPPNEVDFHVL